MKTGECTQENLHNATVKINGNVSDFSDVTTGVRQGISLVKIWFILLEILTSPESVLLNKTIILRNHSVYSHYKTLISIPKFLF